MSNTSHVLIPLGPFKWIVHSKMKIQSSFSHRHIVPKLYVFISSVNTEDN